MPASIIALARTLCLVCVLLASFQLGEMTVSFTGSQWAWMVLAANTLVVVGLSLELLRAIWSHHRVEP